MCAEHEADAIFYPATGQPLADIHFAAGRFTSFAVAGEDLQARLMTRSGVRSVQVEAARDMLQSAAAFARAWTGAAPRNPALSIIALPGECAPSADLNPLSCQYRSLSKGS